MLRFKNLFPEVHEYHNKSIKLINKTNLIDSSVSVLFPDVNVLKAPLAEKVVGARVEERRGVGSPPLISAEEGNMF